MGAKGRNSMNAAIDTQNVDSKQLCLSVLNALEEAVTCSNSLTQGDELDLVEATCPEIRKSRHDAAKKVLAAIAAISSRYAVIASCSESDSNDSGSEASLTPYDIVFDRVLETTEEALEQFNSALDNVRGIKDAVVVQPGALGPECRIAALTGTHRKRQGAFVEMEKPQNHFPDYPIDNSDTTFVAPYAEGPDSSNADTNARQEQNGDAEVGVYLRNLFKTNSKPNVGGATGRKHPYEDEVQAAAIEMSKKEFKEEDTSVYGSLESTPCTLVITEEELFNMAERLKCVTEIAVDIENHSVRSFQGFICLIQISTRREDFVVDALALRGSIHRALAPVFTDESTVKVLHGADRDVQWLERDFGIYVVNMFDTGQAARLLKFPSASLAFLQARFCDVTGTSKKKFQLADWRQRPLPDDMFQYARSDTHYLLYIYDRLRTELAKKKNLVRKAWERSAVVSRKRHMKIRFDPGMPRHLCAKYGLGFDQHQIRLLEELYRWRDRRAREEDESLNYVAPLGTLFGIVRARDKARTVEGLLSHGFPSKTVPPVIKTNAEEIIRLISDALDAKLEDNPKEGADKSQPAKPAGNKQVFGEDDRVNVAGGGIGSTMRQPCWDGITSASKLGHTPRAVPIASVKASVRSESSLFDLDSSDSDSDEHVPKVAENGARETDLPVAMATTRELKRPRGMRTEIKAKAMAAATSEFDLCESEENAFVEKSAPDQNMKKNVMPVDKTDASENDRSSVQAPPVFNANGGPSELGPEDPLMHETTPKVTAARSSVFDLSDGDEASGGEARDAQSYERKQSENTEELLARVRAGMCELAPRGPTVFRVETDIVAADDCELEESDTVKSYPSAKKRGRDEEEDEESVPMSLQQQYGLKHGQMKKKNKKRKKKRTAVGEVAAEVPAFDYAKVLREEKTRRKEEKREKPFDPMRKLRLDWKDKGKGKKRPRKARKSPGSGVRSMSFRGK